MRLLRDGAGKLGRRAATLVTFLVLAGLMCLVFVGIGAASDRLAEQPGAENVGAILVFPGAYDAVLGFVVGFGSLLALIYGAAIAGSEWAWGTLKNAVARGESRVGYALATFGAIALLLAVGVVLSIAVGVAAALLGASLAGVPTDGVADAAALGALPGKAARVWFGVVSAAAIGFAMATVARSQLAGIGAGVATYFGERFGTILFPDIVRWLPFHAAEAAADVSAPGADGGLAPVEPLSSAVALIVVIAWSVVALAVGALATDRAEITG